MLEDALPPPQADNNEPVAKVPEKDASFRMKLRRLVSWVAILTPVN
jgi:hypothetical protein